MPKIWGYILDAPGRPDASTQREALTVLGAKTGPFGTIFCDKIARGSTRPQGQLRERNALIHGVRRGDTVVIAAPFCLGVSDRDAGWFVAQLANKGASLVVSEGIARLEPGENPAELLAKVASAQNVHHVRASKQRARASR